jgi:hypothetical protein
MYWPVKIIYTRVIRASISAICNARYSIRNKESVYLVAFDQKYAQNPTAGHFGVWLSGLTTTLNALIESPTEPGLGIGGGHQHKPAVAQSAAMKKRLLVGIILSADGDRWPQTEVLNENKFDFYRNPSGP